MSEYTGKRNRTRQAFLEAADGDLAGAVGRGILSALGPAHLARRAGLSRQTFYRHWPGGDGFLDDLAAYILTPERAYESTLIPDLAEVPAAGPRSATEMVRRAAMVEFGTEAQLRPLLREVVCRALLVEGLVLSESGGADPPDALREALHLAYAGLADRLVPAYESLIDGWGREMVPGVTVRQLAAVLTGLLDGMAMRGLFDPDLAPPWLYADAVLALIPAFTQRRTGAATGSPASFLSDEGSEGDEDEESAGARETASETAQSSQMRSGRTRAEASRSAIVAAARNEFALRGYRAATISGVATAAGLGETTVYEHFGSKAGLAAACFVPGHDEAVAALAADTSDPMTRLHNHLVRVYALLVADREAAKALFDAVVQSTMAGEPPDSFGPLVRVPLPDAMVPVLAEAQAAGSVTSDVDSREIAGVLVSVVLLGVLMNPMDPEAACLRYESFVFDGLLTDAGRRGRSARR